MNNQSILALMLGWFVLLLSLRLKVLVHWLEACGPSNALLLTGSGYLQLYLSYLSLDFKLLSGSSYLFLGRSVVVLASEFESYDAPLFRLRLIENE